MENSLKDKIVLVTGSSLGIGAALVKEFAKHGANIVVTYNHNKAKADKVSEECLKLGAKNTLVLKLDVTKTSEIQEAVTQIISQFGQIDILVNNAGVLYESKLTDMSFAEIEEQLRVNLEGLIKTTKIALPYTKEAIVNIASQVGSKPYPELATYVASKWAVRGFSKSLALETDTPVYIINPDGTNTQMNDFTGTSVERVAEIVIDVLTGKIPTKSGDDINVADYKKPQN